MYFKYVNNMINELTLVFFSDIIHFCQEPIHHGWRDKMKSTGIVRRVDELGRIVLPIELRRTLDIAEKDSLEIYMEGDAVIIRKYQPACVFCDSAKEIVSDRGKNVCSDCIRMLAEKL